VGQRKGLGISLGLPVFVTSVDAEANAVVVGPRSDLGVSELLVEETSFIDAVPQEGLEVLVQHRAHGEVAPGRLYLDEAGARVVYDQPVQAIAPGQSAAFYNVTDPDELLGGGIIASTVAATAVA
jgi:tRNA-specific 2-thiouridylase